MQVIFGPRGTRKSTWIDQTYQDALTFDLLEDNFYQKFSGNAQRLSNHIPVSFKGMIVVDEIQKITTLLDEVHRLI